MEAADEKTQLKMAESSNSGVPMAPDSNAPAGTLIQKMTHFLRTEVMPGEKLDRESSLQRGKELRRTVKRSAHAGWEVQKDRTEPIAILEEQEKTRVQSLLSIRHERMLASAFAYYRGTAAVMAADLAKMPVTGIMVQACGDAHIGNFGVFSSAEHRLVFDINDFDETYPGPWEWDVKRLAASIEICGRYRGFSESDRRRAVRKALDSYHDAMMRFSSMGTMDVWYSHLDVNQMMADHADKISGSTERMISKVVADAATKNSWRAVHKWTETVDGKLRIRSIPPILVPYREMPQKLSPEKLEKFFRISLAQYRMSLPREVRKLIDQYTPVDIAQKVAGVGSVGLRSYIMVLEGTAADDPLVLQFKETGNSVLAPYVTVKDGAARMAERHQMEEEEKRAENAGSPETGKTAEAAVMADSRETEVTGDGGRKPAAGVSPAEDFGSAENPESPEDRNMPAGIFSSGTTKIRPRIDQMKAVLSREDNGKRVVTGQKAIQTAGDLLLGWMRVPNIDGELCDFYVRQLWNNKGTIDLTTVTPEDLTWLAGVCGWTLAHAHARTGDRHAIAGYLGKSRKFEEAVTVFAEQYADQNDEDYRVYVRYYSDRENADGQL